METINPTPPRHDRLDDAQGILFGTFMCSVGLHLLAHMGFITGQTAGLALLISYATGWGFGPVFFTISLPFYWLGYRRFGLVFMLKSFAAVALVSMFAALLPNGLAFGTINPAVAALLFGCLTGAGLLALFRHGASLGGVGIVALHIQDSTGFRAGWTQIIFDACLFTAALFLREWHTVAWSFAGAAVLNAIIAINHRRDRYVA